MDSALPRYATDELATKHPDELLALLVHDEDRAPLELIEECARRGEAILAGIDAILQDDGLWDDLSTGEWWLRFHMAMILGRLSSARAGGMLVTLMHRLDDERDDDLQDWLAGWWPALFRNKPAAVMPELRELAGDETHDWYIRSGALEAVLESGRAHGANTYDEALDWAAGIVGNEQANWEMRCVAGGVLLEHTPQRHRSLLEGLGRRQAERPYPFFDHEDVANAYDAPRTDVRSQWADPWGNFYSPSAISERQERWAREAREARAREPVRAPIAVGRNDPCPCGSGKKYKRCCLQ